MLKNKSHIRLICTIFLTFFLFQERVNAEELIKVQESKKYKGALDFGATLSNGNSKEQSVQSNFNFDYHFNEKTVNILKARGENTKTNNVRTREKYYLNNQIRKNISISNFKFIELEYISDRFGGYNYRASESAGIGRKLIENEKTKLTIQSSAGMRQSKLTTDEKSNNVIIRVGSNLGVKINEAVSFEEALDISFDQNATITRSDANLKILISKKLYLKFGVLFEHVSHVPEGTKNSDVTTSLKLGYEF